MSKARNLHSLGRLVDLRAREVERLTAEVAAKQVEHARYLDNLARLEQLRDSSGASGALPPALSPSTRKISHLLGSFSLQSASLPGSEVESSAVLRRVSSRALRAASRAREAVRHLSITCLATDGFSSR